MGHAVFHRPGPAFPHPAGVSLDTGHVFLAYQRENGGGGQRLLYVENIEAAHGVFLPAHGGGYSGPQKRQRLHCQGRGGHPGSPGAECRHDDLLPCGDDPLLLAADAGGPWVAGDQCVPVPIYQQKTYQHHPRRHAGSGEAVRGHHGGDGHDRNHQGQRRGERIL